MAGASRMMFSREFVSWASSRPFRLIAMIAMVVVLTFTLTVSVGLILRQIELSEMQVRHLERIDSNAKKALDEANRVKVEVKGLEKQIEAP